MPDLFENPIGLDGFEFVEFCAPEKGVIEPVFKAMGFTHVASHRSKDVDLWRQGQINLILNYEPRSAAWFFAREHGPSACGMGFRVRDAKKAYDELLRRGAEPVAVETGPMELRIPAIRGIGGAIVYLVDRYADDHGNGLSIYDIDFEYLDGVEKFPVGAGFNVIDHLTHNVYNGRMKYWADYYETLFNFREIRFFDIKGEGIQHIALICDDLLQCWDNLKQLGVPFMTAPPATYYEMLSERLPGHGEDENELQMRGILLDGTTEGGQPRLLLQIFAEAQVGPVFFEFIQRKGDDGFGEGNFKALFESMERDQIKRGALTVGEAEAAAKEPAE